MKKIIELKNTLIPIIAILALFLSLWNYQEIKQDKKFRLVKNINEKILELANKNEKFDIKFKDIMDRSEALLKVVDSLDQSIPVNKIYFVKYKFLFNKLKVIVANFADYVDKLELIQSNQKKKNVRNVDIKLIDFDLMMLKQTVEDLDRNLTILELELAQL